MLQNAAHATRNLGSASFRYTRQTAFGTPDLLFGLGRLDMHTYPGGKAGTSHFGFPIFIETGHTMSVPTGIIIANTAWSRYTTDAQSFAEAGYDRPQH